MATGLHWFYQCGLVSSRIPKVLTLIPVWIHNHYLNKVWNETTCQSPNFYCCTAKFGNGWIILSYFTVDVVTYPCWAWISTTSVKAVPVVKSLYSKKVITTTTPTCPTYTKILCICECYSSILMLGYTIHGLSVSYRVYVSSRQIWIQCYLLDEQFIQCSTDVLCGVCATHSSYSSYFGLYISTSQFPIFVNL